MFSHLIIYLFLSAFVTCSLFDFLQKQFHAEQAMRQQNQFESQMLNADCQKYLCPETGACADKPEQCGCPFPSSQLRCPLSNGRYLCVSKPAGDVSQKYHDPATNWKIDAKDNNVRDCGWVKRAYEGLV